MDETNLRHLEQQFKMRVRTGCETCRIRRVKCDEAKPECNRCTKTGRKCAGYDHVTKPKSNSATASAAYRNSSFLVVPQKQRQLAITRNPSGSLSPDSLENRSFHFFQAHTLPRWTDFFESELWGRKLLQLAHVEPAIKHGILALSTMHEDLESSSPNLNTKLNNFAFLQYMRAVKHSNELLIAHQQGNLDLEKVLIACVIFTCYENLAGNFKAANMHMQNGLRIMKQHKYDGKRRIDSTQESVANILYRFDLQAMTFSEQNTQYQYQVRGNPGCPPIADWYTNNIEARNDLVGLLRCTLWISGIACEDPKVMDQPLWNQATSELSEAREKWEDAFFRYQENLSDNQKGDPKIYAGNTLLRMYAIIVRIAVTNGLAWNDEIRWDRSADFFKTIVDLAETLPQLQPRSATPPRRSVSPKLQRSPGSAKERPIVPNSATYSSPSPPGMYETVFRVESSLPQHSPPSVSSSAKSSMFQRAPSSFSPSFELSPILPLFLAITRCRNPIIRRRALALLLNCRRREGVWDSLSAGIVAKDWLMQEENIMNREVPADNWVPLTPGIESCEDIPEERRISDVIVKVNSAEETVSVTYKKSDGTVFVDHKNPYEVGLFIGSSKSDSSYE